MKGKKVILWVLVGWGLSVLLGPRDVIAWFKPRAA